jgi:catalase
MTCRAHRLTRSRITNPQKGTTMTDTQPTPRPTTTNAGIPVESDEHSLTIGPDGPILLHDHYLVEQLAQFNRERVPERQPHAKGSGAYGPRGSACSARSRHGPPR